MSLEGFPHRIHQTWKDSEPPARWLGFRATWQRCWPNWQVHLWTDADNRALIADRYPELLALYDAYPRPIQRADLARYCWLHHAGGIYADLDVECLRPFPELLAADTLLFGLEPAAHLGPPQRRRGLGRVWSNALIAGPAGHPFWPALFAALLDAAGEPDPLDATGPFLLTKVAEAWRSPGRLEVLDERYFSPLDKYTCWRGTRQALPAEAVAIHHWDGSWWRSPDELAQTFASHVREPSRLDPSPPGPTPDSPKPKERLHDRFP